MDTAKINESIATALEKSGGYDDGDRKAIAAHLSKLIDAQIAFARFIMAPEAYEPKEIDDLISFYVGMVLPELTAVQGLLAKRTVVPIEDVVERVVAGDKLKPEERKVLRKTGISAQDLIRSITSILTQEGFYPPQATVWTPGEEVYDGAFLELMKDGHCRFHFQKARDLDAFMLEEGRCVMMDKVEEAITRYIQWRWKEGIEGVPIIF